ncbi:MAG: hypothetical protein ACI9HK_001454 [Pirellulaceae bacterium]
MDSTAVFNELMYNPEGDPDQSLEYIELFNQLAVDIDLSEWRIEGGVDYTFADGTTIPGRGYLVIAKTPAELEAETGLTNVLGPFGGSLNNAGEELRLYNNDERLLNVVNFGDSGDWTSVADGSGASLAKANEFTNSAFAENWTFSPQVGGTPGAQNFDVQGAPVDTFINEVSAAATGLGEFWFEITNAGSVAIDVAGYQVKTETGQFTLGAQTLNSGEFLVIDETDLGFDVDNNDHVFLLNPAGDTVIDGRRVTTSLRGLTDRYDGRWLYPDVGTPNAANSFAFNDDIVINEVMYHFRADPVPYTESTEEWIELYNRGAVPISLSGWKLDDAVRYDFPATTTIQPDEYLLIARDPVALQTKYPTLDIVGPFAGVLSNGDDRIRLEDAAGNLADEVHYYDGGSWAAYADGGGSSLELSDPFADNARGEVWDASDESDAAVWTTYSYRHNADVALINNTFNEFIFGLLDAGEFLIDDVSVVLNPDTTATEMMQNGSFEGDPLGASPAAWRLIGNHVGTVVVDPADAGNQVLHVTARGAQAHVHDHAETTFINNAALVNGGDYEMSFRLRWVAGNSQLNNRLYFNRASNTALLEVPENLGTPGAVNSNFLANAGPTYESLRHSPAVPLPSETVTVTIAASDPDGLSQVDLIWRVNADQFSTTPMTLGGDGLYRAIIPERAANDVVQFYVAGQDAVGAVSTFPKEGEDSRAQYEVFEGLQTNNPIDTLRLIIAPADNSHLFSQQERMSNDTVGATLIVNNKDIYYNIRVRQTGSRYIRPNSGYKVALNPEQKYHGVHESIRLDMNGLNEIYMKQMVSRAGGSSVSMYDDISYIVTPQHSGRSILLNLARYEDVFLEEQFLNGSDGTKWELDDITFPTGPQPAPEGLKTDTGVSAQDMRYRGDDPENYRGQLLIKNNRVKDDFEKIVGLTEALSNSGNDLYDAAEEVMDVDLWMRHYATQSWLGNWDTYGFRRPKNLRVYERPSDGKIIPLFWDADLANLTENFIYNDAGNGVSRLDELRNIPHVERLFWGHMWDLMNRSFNLEYISPWISEFQSLGQNFSGELNKVSNRTITARSQAQAEIPQVPFQFTTNGGNEVTVDASAATLQGTGWINVREIHYDNNALDVTWIDEDTWEVTIPVPSGTSEVTLEAFDFEGNPVCDDNSVCEDSSITITVTSTVVDRPLQEFLRITEVMYNPIDATATEIVAGYDKSDDFEYIEFHNISPTETLDLSGAMFVSGVTYTFPANTMLGPNEFLLVVEDIGAMAERYGNGLNIVGQWSGGLSSTSDHIKVVDSNNAIIADFTYSDSGDWPGRADGNGSSLTPVADTVDYANPDSWQSSADYGGSPGVANTPPRLDIVVNEVLSHTDPGQVDSIELHNTTGEDINIGGWLLSDNLLNLDKFIVPANTLVPGNGYLVFDENDFNVSLGVDPRDFALNGAHGDEVVLAETDVNGDPIRFVDHVEFGAQANGESWARTPNGNGILYPAITESLNGPNGAPRIGPVVLNEIQYHPVDPGNGILPANLEFVELYNTESNSIDMTNWRLRGGVDFDFAGNFMFPGESFLVIVPFDPNVDAQLLSDFQATHGIDGTVTLVGPFIGQLANGGEELHLQRPDAPPLDEPGFTPRLLEDRTDYDDGAPWPTTADGLGHSINRIDYDAIGDYATSWQGFAPSPGSVPAAAVTNVTSPTANGSYTIESVLEFTVTFSEDLTVVGNPQLSLDLGGASRFANYDESLSGSNILTFTYEVQAGDFTDDLAYSATNALTLNGGTIKNAMMLNASLILPVPGTPNSLSFQKDIQVDAVPPTFAITRDDPSPTAASSVVFSVDFNRLVQNVDVADFGLNLIGVTADATVVVGNAGDNDDSTYTVTVNSIAGFGALGLQLVGGNNIADAIGIPVNQTPSTNELYSVDTVIPTFAVTRDGPSSSTADSELVFSVDFSRDVQNVDAADFGLDLAGSLTASANVVVGDADDDDDSTYTVTVNTVVGFGTLGLLLDGGNGITNATGLSPNTTPTSNQLYDVDTLPPTFSITRAGPNPSTANRVTFNVDFNREVENVSAADFAVVLDGVTTANSRFIDDADDDDASTYTVTIFTVAGEGTLGLEVTAGNNITNTSGTPVDTTPTLNEVYTVDTVSPVVSRFELNSGMTDPDDLDGREQPTTWASQRSEIFNIQVEFSEDVDLEVGDILLTNLGRNPSVDPNTLITLIPSQLDVSGNVATLTFDYDEITSGVYELRVAADVTDAAGNRIDGNGDGAGGDSYVISGNSTNRFYRMKSDFNGDAGTSVFDFSTFSYWFGQQTPRAPLYADMNGDDGVSVFDFTHFSNNFGLNVELPVVGFANPFFLAPAVEDSVAVENPQIGVEQLEPTSPLLEPSTLIRKRVEVEAIDSEVEDESLESVLDVIAEMVAEHWN